MESSIEFEFDNDYTQDGDRYEIGYRSQTPDGTPTIGRIIGLADSDPPTLIFEEAPADLSQPPTIRKFDHGTPENVSSFFAIKSARDILVSNGLRSLLRSEITSQE